MAGTTNKADMPLVNSLNTQGAVIPFLGAGEKVSTTPPPQSTMDKAIKKLRKDHGKGGC